MDLTMLISIDTDNYQNDHNDSLLDTDSIMLPESLIACESHHLFLIYSIINQLYK